MNFGYSGSGDTLTASGAGSFALDGTLPAVIGIGDLTSFAFTFDLYDSADPSFHGQFTYGLSDLFSFSARVEADPFGDPVLTALALETTFVDSALAGAPEIFRVTSLAGGGAQTPVLFKFFPLLLTVGDVTTGAVPEPATVSLLGLGLAGMGARRWRQRKP